VAVVAAVLVGSGVAVAAVTVINAPAVPGAEGRRVDRPTMALVVGDSGLAALNWAPAAAGAVTGFEHVLDLESCRRLYAKSCPGRNGPPPTVYEALAIHGRGFETLVVATGYNEGGVNVANSFQQVVARARELGYRRIVWWTLRSVPGYPSFEVTDAAIVDQLATGNYPDVVLADWGAYSAGYTGWFTDGVHFTVLGAWAAADYLTRKMAFLDGRGCPSPPAPGAPDTFPCPDPDVTGPQTDLYAIYPI
jgi:hypothetical protein